MLSMANDSPPLPRILAETSDPPDPARRLRLFAWACYGAGLALSWAVGMRPWVPFSHYHYLPADLLANRLAESLFFLHAQPPLLNLMAGVLLKLEAASGISHASLALLLQVPLGAGVVWGTLRLVVRFLGHGRAAFAAIALLVLNPVFYQTIFEFFYTLHETLWLTLAAVALTSYFDHGRLVKFLAAALAMVALVYTRSLFHFGWAAAMLTAIALLPKPACSRDWPPLRRRLMILAAALALLFAWPIKNLLIFDAFSYSSWQGYNLSMSLLWAPGRMLPGIDGLYETEYWSGTGVRWTSNEVELGLAPEGRRLRVSYLVVPRNVSAAEPLRVSLRLGEGAAVEQIHTAEGLASIELEAPDRGAAPLRLRLRTSRLFRSDEGRMLGVALYPLEWVDPPVPRPVRPALLDELWRAVPERHRHIPALTRPWKSADAMNWNHWFIVEDCRLRQRMAIQAVHEHPSALLIKARDNYWFSTRFTGRQAYSGSFDFFSRPARAWLKLWEIGLYQDFRGPNRLQLTENGRIPGPGTWLAGFVILLPLYLGFAGWTILARWRTDTALSLTAAFMLACFLWVLLMVLLIDGIEGNRMRISTEPFLWLLLIWAARSARRARTPQRPEPRPGVSGKHTEAARGRHRVSI